MSVEKAKPKKKGDALILFVVLLAFGLILGGVGLYRYNLGRKSASWPVAKGSMTASRPQPVTTENNRNEYRLSVSYKYAVNGKTYTGTRITASDIYEKTRKAAEEALSKYPVGGEVSVYYDPDDPAISLLETGIRENVYALMGASVLSFMFAAAVAVSALRQNSKHPHSPSKSAGASG